MRGRRATLVGMVVLIATALCVGAALVVAPGGKQVDGVPDANLVPADRSVLEALVAGSDEIRYFAYGSNMDHGVFIERRGFHPVTEEAAYARGHQLVFGAPGINRVEPAFAALQSAQARSVHGVLYVLPRAEVPRLHRLEDGYESYYIEVVGRESGSVRAFTYGVAALTVGLRPSRRYVESLLRGARQHGLPSDYIEELEHHPVTHIPMLSSLTARVVPFVEKTFFDQR